jgi:hypothetical protein
MPRKRKVPVATEVPQKAKTAAPPTNEFSQEQWNVLNVIVSCQKSDANVKKCSAELNKLYGKVRILSFSSVNFSIDCDFYDF